MRVRQTWGQCDLPPGVVAVSKASGPEHTEHASAGVVLSRHGQTITVSHTPLPRATAPETADAGTPVRAFDIGSGGGDARIVCGCADAHTLFAVIPSVTRPTVKVWSSLTAQVVACLEMPGRPSLFKFDLMVATAVVDNVLLVSSLHGPKEWHPVSAAGNLATTFVAWPHILALERHGHYLWYTNIEAGVSSATAVATRHAVESGGTQLQRAPDTRDRGDAQAHALKPQRLTACCVGHFAACGTGAIEWTSIDVGSRSLVVNTVVLDDMHRRHRPTPIQRTHVPWPMAHKDLYPDTDSPALHCTVPWPGKTAGDATTRHVLVSAHAPGVPGSHAQLLQTVVGTWHKTHLVARGTPAIRDIAAASAPGTVGIQFEDGNYALLQTT